MKSRKEIADRVRVIYHPAYLTDYTTASCEVPGRVRAVMEGLDGYERITPAPCTEDDILLCHSEGLILSERRDPQRFEVACLAAGGAIRCARLAMEGFITFGAIRPPGHHASPDQNWGFCFFNNMAIALRRLIKDSMIRRAFVLDIDLHFGDGTDNVFKYDNTVEVRNIQSSTPDNFISETMSALKAAFPADIIGISAGFDQYERDWGANLSTEDYRAIGSLAGQWARENCGGRIFAILEGGYYLPDLGLNSAALVEGMAEGALLS